MRSAGMPAHKARRNSPDGNDVRADTGLRHQLQYGDIRIGLDREADERIEIAERGFERIDALADCRRGVGMARRPDAQRERREIDAVEA